MDHVKTNTLETGWRNSVSEFMGDQMEFRHDPDQERIDREFPQVVAQLEKQTYQNDQNLKLPRNVKDWRVNQEFKPFTDELDATLGKLEKDGCVDNFPLSKEDEKGINIHQITDNSLKTPW